MNLKSHFPKPMKNGTYQLIVSEERIEDTRQVRYKFVNGKTPSECYEKRDQYFRELRKGSELDGK